MLVGKSRVLVFLSTLLLSVMLWAEGEVALSVRRSFSQAVYTPGEATTVTVTLDIDYTGSNKDYPQNNVDGTEGYIFQVNYDEKFSQLPSGCSVLWGKASFSPSPDESAKTKDEETQDDGSVKFLGFTVNYEYHVEDDVTGDKVARNFPLQYTYKISISEAATEDIVFSDDSAGILGYYAPVEGGLKSVSLRFAIEGDKVIKAGKAQADMFSVYYHANHGQDNEPYQVPELTAGTHNTLAFDATGLPVKENATFVAWNTKADGTGESYDVNASFEITDADVNFYAQWQDIQVPVEEYEITYHGNGGQTAEGADTYTSQKIQKGTGYTLDANRFARNHYSFTGWLDADNQPVAGTVTVNGNLDLYAQWSRNQVTVTYEPGEGATFEAPLSVQVDAGSEYALTAVKPERANATFVGWSLNGVQVGDTIAVEETALVLVALWEEVQGTATIVYHRGADAYLFTMSTPESETVECEAGDVVIAGSAYFFPYGGMAIGGWATEDIPGASVAYQEGDTVSLKADETLHLYAAWNYYADLTLAGIVRPDFDFAGPEEEAGIYDSSLPRLQVSNSPTALGDGNVVAPENAYLWFRMINYGFIDSGSFKVVAKLTKDGEEPVVLSRGTVLRRVYSENFETYETLSEDYNEGTIEKGLTSDGYLWEHAVVCLELGQLAAGSYKVQVVLDADEAVEEVTGTADDGVQGGGETDNEFELTFEVTDVPAATYSVTYHTNAAFSGINDPAGDDTSYPKSEQTVVLAPVDVDAWFGYLGWEFVEWNTSRDGQGDRYVCGETLTQDLELYAVWRGLPQLWFYPMNSNEDVQDWNYVTLTTDNSSIMLPEYGRLYANEPIYVNFQICNYFTGKAGAFEVGLTLTRLPVDDEDDVDPTEVLKSEEIACDAMIGEGPLQKKYACTQFALPAGAYKLVCRTDVNDKVKESCEEAIYENLATVKDENGEDVWISGYKEYTVYFVVVNRTYELTVDGGTGSGTYGPGTEVEIVANEPAEGMVFDHWEAEVGSFADPKAARTVFTMPARSITVTAVYVERKPFEEWPEEAELYAPRRNKIFTYSPKHTVTFSWPALGWASQYDLQVKNFAGKVVFADTTSDLSLSVMDLPADSYVWTVAARDDQDNALESPSFTFAVMEDNGLPIIREVKGSLGGGMLTIGFEKGTADRSINCQMLFYSLDDQAWLTKSAVISIKDEQAVVLMGNPETRANVSTERGYFFIRTLEKDDANFIECVVGE